MPTKNHGKSYSQIRAEIAHKYNEQIRELKATNSELTGKIDSLSEENEKLKAELASKSEWIERMQEFCNMSDEDRKNYIEAEIAKKDAHQAMTILASGIGRTGILDLLKSDYNGPFVDI